MPRKNRSRKRPPLPSFSNMRALERKDFHGKVGTWHVDAAITALIESGKCRYPPNDWFEYDSPHPHWLIRPQLIAAASNAFVHAWGARAWRDSRPASLEDLNQLETLQAQVRAFVTKHQEYAHKMLELGTPQAMIEELDITKAASVASELNSRLHEIIASRAALYAPTTTPNADHLSQRFVSEMRFVWRFLTRTDPLATGGKLLVSLASGTWKDAGFPAYVEESEQPLDDWMTRRFKACR